MGMVSILMLVSALALGAPTNATVAAVQKANAEAQAENTLIAQAQTAMDMKDWQAAEAPLQKLVSMDPGHWEYRQNLANVQMNLRKFPEAAQSYATAIQAAGADPDKNRTAIGVMLVSEGNAYLKLHRDADAIAAYTKAAPLSADPAVAWFNICATEYNTGNTAGALASCDQAIALDPKKADAYFIKGSLLLAASTLGADNKPVAPAGTVEALQMYLKLAPTGPHAADVQQMLDYLK
jgi:tetratricopeptide (TPR) repeat protein